MKNLLKIVLSLLIIMMFSFAFTFSSDASSTSHETYALLVVTSNADLNNAPFHSAEATKTALHKINNKIKKENIKIICEDEINTDNFNDVIRQYFSKMTDDDFGVFCYYGHGYYNEGNLTSAYLTFKNENGKYEQYSTSDLANVLSGISGKFLVNLTSCYSGGAISKPSQVVQNASPSDVVLDMVENEGFYNRDKFYVITSSCAVEESFSETSSNNMDMSSRAFVSALGVNAQCAYSEDEWAGENQSLGNVLCDENEDKNITFYELTQYIKKNTPLSNVQCFPENSQDVIFSCENRETFSESSYEVLEKTDIVTKDDFANLTLKSTNDILPTVYFKAVSPMGDTIFSELLDGENLSDGTQKYSVKVSDWEELNCFFEIYHPQKGLGFYSVCVENERVSPTAKEVFIIEQNDFIVPKYGREYILSFEFSTPCYFDVEIRNSSNEIVKVLSKNDLSSKNGYFPDYRYINSYYWDGTDCDFKPVEDGYYTYYAKVHNQWGEQIIKGNATYVYNLKKCLTLKINCAYSILNEKVQKSIEYNSNYANVLLIKNTTYVPIRFAAQSLGYNVKWNNATNEVVLENPISNELIKTKLGSNLITYSNSNNETISQTSATSSTILIGGAYYIPLRTFSQMLGFGVSFYQPNSSDMYVIVHSEFENVDKQRAIYLCEELEKNINCLQ